MPTLPPRAQQLLDELRATLAVDADAKLIVASHADQSGEFTVIPATALAAAAAASTGAADTASLPSPEPLPVPEVIHADRLTLSARSPLPTDPPRDVSCSEAILAALLAAGQRMTTLELHRFLQQRHQPCWSLATVRSVLADLVEAGTLTNRQDARPRGYGLPSIDESGRN